MEDGYPYRVMHSHGFTSTPERNAYMYYVPSLSIQALLSYVL
jgi:hypothetical protein